MDQKVLFKKSRKFQKAKLEFATCQQLFTYHLHYIRYYKPFRDDLKYSMRREWQPTPVFLPGEYHEQRSLAGYSPWGHKESDTTEAT